MGICSCDIPHPDLDHVLLQLQKIQTQDKGDSNPGHTGLHLISRGAFPGEGEDGIAKANVLCKKNKVLYFPETSPLSRLLLTHR